MPTSFRDYYQTLGLPKTANDKEIISRFRILAKETHPDLHRNEDAETRKAFEEKFKVIGEAYACLSDAENRKEYDRIYEQKLKEEREGSTQRPAQETRRSEGAHQTPSGFPNYESIFSQFWNINNSEWTQRYQKESEDLFSRWQRESDDLMRGWMGSSPTTIEGLFGFDKRPASPTSQSPRADQAAERRAYDEKYRKERERIRDKEEKERLEKREVEKNQALNTEIKIPENDRYLVLAMMKMIKNKDLDKIDVQDENGILLWRVEGIIRGMVPPGFEVSRGLADVVDWDKNIKIRTKEGGQMFPVEVEREIIPGRVFDVRDIDETSKWKGREGLPKGLREYVPTLGNLAYSLTIMEERGGKGWVNEGALHRVENYLNVNRELNFGEIKEIKPGEITKGLNENRLTEIPKMDEGKFNDK